MSTVLIFTVYNRAKTVQENRETIYQTSTVNTLLEKVMSSTIDIEASARGFAITGNTSYLETFEKKNKEAKKWIDSLRSMKLNNTLETKKLDTIEKLILAKITFSDSTIESRKTGGIEGAAKLIETGNGKKIMDSIKGAVSKYQEKQIIILSDKLKQTENTVQTRNMVFMFFVCIIAILIFIAYALIRKTATQLIEQDEIQRSLIEELSRQNNQLNDFSSMISHNLRAPAANITMLVDNLNENATKEEAKAIFDMLRKVSQNLNETLNNLLDVLTLKSNKKITNEDLNFEWVLSKTLDNLQAELLKKEVTITADFVNAPIISYPQLYLDSIFHNLVSNAIKYADPKRKPMIKITSRKLDHSIHLSVQDNGLGIDLVKYGSKIFGMNKVFHHHPDAKGIGLFMTKMQIERLGGKISVQSEVNVGSTFTIIFNK